MKAKEKARLEDREEDPRDGKKDGASSSPTQERRLSVNVWVGSLMRVYMRSVFSSRRLLRESSLLLRPLLASHA